MHQQTGVLVAVSLCCIAVLPSSMAQPPRPNGRGRQFLLALNPAAPPIFIPGPTDPPLEDSPIPSPVVDKFPSPSPTRDKSPRPSPTKSKSVRPSTTMVRPPRASPTRNRVPRPSSTMDKPPRPSSSMEGPPQPSSTLDKTPRRSPTKNVQETPSPTKERPTRHSPMHTRPMRQSPTIIRSPTASPAKSKRPTSSPSKDGPLMPSVMKPSPSRTTPPGNGQLKPSHQIPSPSRSLPMGLWPSPTPRPMTFPPPRPTVSNYPRPSSPTSRPYKPSPTKKVALRPSEGDNGPQMPSSRGGRPPSSPNAKTRIPTPSPTRPTTPRPSPKKDGHLRPSPANNGPPRPSPSQVSDGDGMQVNCNRTCRQLNGMCTSLKNPVWGRAQGTQFSYLKGESSQFPSGLNLRSARDISNILSDQRADIPNMSRRLNELFVFFGQFLDHNLVATPAQGVPWPIIVPENDEVFPPGSELEFTRSTRGMTGEGMNERPINTLSSAVDLTAVYGPNKQRNEGLLEKDQNDQLTGRLKTSGSDDLLPRNNQEFLNAPVNTSDYFLAGDHRVNEHPTLTALHTIFLREHNRLCEEIKKKIPFITPMTLFEFARKINIAQFQKVVYEEFYPAVIRRRLPKYSGFKTNVDPTVSDIFAGAAYRVGHTMVGNKVSRKGPNGFLTPFTMEEVFFKVADLVTSEEVDNQIRGAAHTISQEVDLKVQDVLRNMLFRNIPGEGGFLDLVSLNIQRGRDHALPKFNQIREICGLQPVKSFRAISRDVTTARSLTEAYNGNVEDVEAWPGLLAEDKEGGNGLGKTLALVWRKEFIRLRDGDQFFYLRVENIPAMLRKRCPELIEPLLMKNKIFHDIIVRNTLVDASQLPPKEKFFFKQ